MKTAKFAALFVTATLSLGMATQAASAQTQTQGKTRTQVVNELKQAQHDGVVPVSKTQYPPTGGSSHATRSCMGFRCMAARRSRSPTTTTT